MLIDATYGTGRLRARHSPAHKSQVTRQNGAQPSHLSARADGKFQYARRRYCALA